MNNGYLKSFYNIFFFEAKSFYNIEIIKQIFYWQYSAYKKDSTILEQKNKYFVNYGEKHRLLIRNSGRIKNSERIKK